MPYAYTYDLPFHMEMMDTIDTEDGFKKWIDEWAFGCKDHEEYCEKVGCSRLMKLSRMEQKFCKAFFE